MNFQAVSALARGVVLESVRRKDLWVVAILGGLILLAAGALGLFGIDGLQIFIKDLAVSVIGVFGNIVAVLTSTRMLPEEIKNRTLYPLLARPISRLDFLLGKFIGSVVVSWIAFLLLVAVTLIALIAFGLMPDAMFAQFVLARMMGFVLVCALGLAISTFMTPAAAATFSMILVFGTTMITRALVYSFSTADPVSQQVYRFIVFSLPQTNLFDLGGRVVYLDWSPVSFGVMAGLFAYMGLYSSVMLGIAWLRFRRQAL